jgi:hypothetical protein
MIYAIVNRDENNEHVSAGRAKPSLTLPSTKWRGCALSLGEYR